MNFAAVLLVADVALLLEDAQLRADGGVAGVARQLRHDVGAGGAAPAVEDVHDLPLAAAQRGLQFLGHCSLGDRDLGIQGFGGIRAPGQTQSP